MIRQRPKRRPNPKNKPARSQNTLASRRRLLLETLEDRRLLAIDTTFAAGVLTFADDGAGANDRVVIEASTTAGEVTYDDGSGLGSNTQAGVNRIVFNGGAGDDELVISMADIFLSQSGATFEIEFNGGSGADLAIVAGGDSGWTSEFTDLGGGAGQFDYSDGTDDVEFSFTSLSQVDDSLVADTFNANFSGASDSINITDGPLLSPVASFIQGPIVIDGGDRDDHGFFGSGANQDGWQFMEQMLEYVLAESFNPSATKDLLVIGANSSTALSAIQSVVGPAGLNIAATTDFITSATDIQNVDFQEYKAFYVPSDAGNTSGGITDLQVAQLSTRTADITDFVRVGGGIVALTEQAVDPVSPSPNLIVDIDDGGWDTELFLFDDAGNLVASNDDNSGDPGSLVRDSYLEVGVPAGTYYIGVSAFSSSAGGLGEITGDRPEGTYSLHVSTDGHALAAGANPTPEVEANDFPTSGTSGRFFDNTNTSVAQNIDGANWTLDANGDITNSTTVPHTTIAGTASNDSFDFYEVTVGTSAALPAGGPYAWLAIPDPFVITGSFRTTQHQTTFLADAFDDAGLGITNTELSNGTPTHNRFVGPAGFNGLDPWVVYPGSSGGVDEVNGGAYSPNPGDPSGTVVFDPTPGDDEITVLGQGAINETIGGGQSISIFDGGAYPLLNIANKPEIDVDGNGGNDWVTINLTSLAAVGGLTGLDVTGDIGNDTIDLQSLPTTMPFDFVGNEGDDNYIVHLADVDGALTVPDLDGEGSDHLTIIGTAGADEFTVTPTETTLTAPARTVPYGAYTEFVTVRGEGDSDYFFAEPSMTAEFTIDGGSPGFGDAGVPPGDVLDFDSQDNYFSIVGKTIFTEGGSPDPFLGVNFRRIESLPLMPIGTDTLLFDFDDYNTSGTLLSTTEAGYTSVGPESVYGVTGTFGWTEALISAGFTSEGSFDRGPGSAAVLDDAVRDGHFADSPQVFTTDIANGWYLVGAKLGDDSLARDNMTITDVDSGRIMVDAVDTSVGEFIDVTFVVLVEDGTLDLELSSTGGDHFWSLNTLEIRPAEILSIGSPDPAPLVTDGEQTTVFTGYEATPNTLITISATIGEIITPDASPDFAGIQVLSNGAGEYTYELAHGTARGLGFVAMQEVTGEHTGCLAIDFVAPDHWLLDFESTTSTTEAGYYQVGPETWYQPSIEGIGWTDPLVSSGGIGEGAFERAGTSAGDQLDARTDGHFSDDADTFTAQVAPGVYYVNATVGDAAQPRSNIDVTVNGTPLGTGVATSANEFFHNGVVVAVGAAGLIELDIDQTSNSFWVINSLEIREVSLVAPVAFNPLGTLTADGSTIDTISGTIGGAGVPDGTLLTIDVDSGVLIEPGIADQATYQGVQVEVVGNAFSFDYIRPSSAGTPAFSAMAVDGSALGAGVPVTYDAPNFLRFDFNGKDNDTEAGFVGVRAGDSFDPLAGYGWTSQPNEFQRGTTGYSVASVSLYRDGAWGSRGASGARTFQVDVGGPGLYDVQVYIGDRGRFRDNIQVETEDGSTAVQASALSANQFGSIVIIGADAGADGLLEITFSDIGGDAYWTVNGVDVAPTGGLPAVAPLQSSFSTLEATPSDLASVSASQVEQVRQNAIDIWAAQGISQQQLQQLQSIPVGIQNMDSAGYLGLSYQGGILVDDNAGGAGWNTQVQTGPSAGRVDLLTTVLHEMGHQLGLQDDYAATESLMYGFLGTGERRMGELASFDHTRSGAFGDSSLSNDSLATDRLFSLLDDSADGVVGYEPADTADFSWIQNDWMQPETDATLLDGSARRRREEALAVVELDDSEGDEGEEL